MTNIEPSYPKSRLYPRLALLAAGLFTVGTNAFVIAGLLPDIAAGLGVESSAIGYSITYYSIIVAIAAPAISILIPRWSRTGLMASGLALIAIGTVLAAASPNIVAFTVGRIIAGLGGAALVPAATAAAVALAPVEKRGRAIAFVAVGFTAATALGSPLGTAIGAAGGWRLPLFIVAGIAAVLAVALLLFLRGVPAGPAASLAQRFAPLRDYRVLLALASTLLITAGFNSVYIFSSSVTALATGGSGALLAALLLAYGVGGIVGNVVSGGVVDRFGSRASGTGFMVAQAVVLAAFPLAATSFAGTAALFVIWGLTAFASVPAIQHRLIGIDPAASGVTLSWYTTAMYAGIGIAPPLGAAALGLGSGEYIPVFGAVAVVLAVAVFQAGFARRRVVVGAVA